MRVLCDCMIETDFRILAKKAKEYCDAGKDWHFHLFSPDCKFNIIPGKHALYLETAGIVAVFECEPLKESETLANLMYGKGFLKKTDQREKNIEFEKIFERVKELNHKGVEWHPHHWHPDCRFNEKPGYHAIAVEDKERGTVLVAYYKQKPVRDIAKLEQLFYKRK